MRLQLTQLISSGVVTPLNLLLLIDLSRYLKTQRLQPQRTEYRDKKKKKKRVRK